MPTSTHLLPLPPCLSLPRPCHSRRPDLYYAPSSRRRCRTWWWRHLPLAATLRTAAASAVMIMRLSWSNLYRCSCPRSSLTNRYLLPPSLLLLLLLLLLLYFYLSSHTPHADLYPHSLAPCLLVLVHINHRQLRLPPRPRPPSLPSPPL